MVWSSCLYLEELDKAFVSICQFVGHKILLKVGDFHLVSHRKGKTINLNKW